MRADRNDKGGGVAAYMRSDVAGDRKPDFKFQEIERISIEIL